MRPESSSASSSAASQPVVGIDVAKKTLDCFIDSPAQRLSLSNDERGQADLVRHLVPLNVRLICIEATGRYHRRLAAELLDAGLPVTLVNPARARDFARAGGKLEKTDRIDAAMLAGFARSCPHRILQMPRPNQAELDDLVSRRRALVQMRVAETNRLADDLPKLARNQGRKLLRLIEQQIEDLDRAIARLIDSDDDWKNKSQIIDSVPGIGAGTAHQLIADLPELGTLSRTEIAKLAGVAPLNHDSGQMRGKRSIGGGRSAVRTVLYMGAFNAIQHNHRFADYAKHLLAKGKQYKVVVTACMRKLLVILNQMIKTNSFWNEKLAFKQP